MAGEHLLRWDTDPPRDYRSRREACRTATDILRHPSPQRHLPSNCDRAIVGWSRYSSCHTTGRDATVACGLSVQITGHGRRLPETNVTADVASLPGLASTGPPKPERETHHYELIVEQPHQEVTE